MVSAESFQSSDEEDRLAVRCAHCHSSCAARDKSLNVCDDLSNALFFFENGGGESIGRQIRNVDLRTRVFTIEIAVAGEQLSRGNFPSALVLFTFIPPIYAAGEFFETH